MSILSQVVSSRLIVINSNEELDLVSCGLSSIRNDMITSDLKRHETDNAARYGILCTKNFTELKKNIRALPEIADLRYATIKDECFIFISNKNAVSASEISVIAVLDSQSTICVIVDCEWNYRDIIADIRRTLKSSFLN